MEFLIRKATAKHIEVNNLSSLLVRDMDDGGMGSLELLPFKVENVKRSFGEEVSSYQFTDIDGVEVLASLNIDQHGNLYELDIWKTNFEPLLSLPTELSLKSHL